jgi:hypothetical protein
MIRLRSIVVEDVEKQRCVPHGRQEERVAGRG